MVAIFQAILTKNQHEPSGKSDFQGRIHGASGPSPRTLICPVDGIS